MRIPGCPRNLPLTAPPRVPLTMVARTEVDWALGQPGPSRLPIHQRLKRAWTRPLAGGMVSRTAWPPILVFGWPLIVGAQFDVAALVECPPPCKVLRSLPPEVTTIPTELGALSGLLLVDLADDALGARRLAGTLPTEVGYLSSLIAFTVQEQAVNGTLPTELAALPVLELLNVQGNHLTGTLALHPEAFPSIVRMGLGENPITGTVPTEVGYLGPTLQIMSMDNTNIVGPLPTELGAGVSVMKYEFNECPQLDGPIPSTMGALTTLTSLRLFSTTMNGTIPGSLGRCTRLRELLILESSFSGALPTTLGLLTGLLSFEFQEVCLAEVVRAAQWSSVALSASPRRSSQNPLQGPIPTEVGAWTQLTALAGRNAGLRSFLPTEIGRASSLRSLQLPQNMLAGPLPSELGLLGQVTNMDLHSNEFVHVPRELAQLSSVTKLSLASSSFQGPVPLDVIFNGQLLREVDISNNEFRGELRFNASDNVVSPALEVLNMNALPGVLGKLPTELAVRSPNIKRISASGTGFSANLPSEFGSMSLLETLALSGNELTGTLPLELFALSTYGAHFPRLLTPPPSLGAFHSASAGGEVTSLPPSPPPLTDWRSSHCRATPSAAASTPC